MLLVLKWESFPPCLPMQQKRMFLNLQWARQESSINHSRNSLLYWMCFFFEWILVLEFPKLKKPKVVWLLATKMPFFRCASFTVSWEHLLHSYCPPVNNISWKQRHCVEILWFWWNIWQEIWIVLTSSFHSDVEVFCFRKAERVCFDFLTLFYFTLILHYHPSNTVFMYLPVIVTVPLAIWKYAEMKEN